MEKALLCLIKRLYSTRAWALSLSKMHRGQGVVVYKSYPAPPPPPFYRIALSPLFLSIFSLFFIFQCPFPAKAGDKNSCLDFVELAAGAITTPARSPPGAQSTAGGAMRKASWPHWHHRDCQLGTAQQVKGLALSFRGRGACSLAHLRAPPPGAQSTAGGSNDEGQLGIGLHRRGIWHTTAGSGRGWKWLSFRGPWSLQRGIHTCALTSGSLLLGEQWKAMGIGPTRGALASHSRLRAWVEMLSFRGLEHPTPAGTSTDAGGEVYCWGLNSLWPAGQGSTGGEYGTPQQVKNTFWYWLSFRGGGAFSGYTGHTCARTSAGEV